MSDIIKLLPDSVANQIAAGEVIQRPASVVKELVENAIDAEASQISIVIKDAGKTLIQVTDNGKGMSETDARMAFERHATSKISSANDLFTIRTMGFRGEALASIAAVADVELKTRQASEELGTRIHNKGSELIVQEPITTHVGCTFLVKNLFFNIPARRKFLKGDATEFGHIKTELIKTALAYPEIDFTLIHNDLPEMKLPVGNFRQRLVAVFGKTYNTALIPVVADTSILTVSGFIGKPELAKKRNTEQFFFVNRRYMRHPYFYKAVLSAYEGLIAGDTNPSFFLNFDIDPSHIDINIHPQKTEINFDDTQGIFSILRASVKEALGKHNIVPSIDFDQDGAITLNLKNKDVNFLPDFDFNSAEADFYNPFNPQYKQSESSHNFNTNVNKTQQTEEWEQLYDGLKTDRNVNYGLQTELPNMSFGMLQTAIQIGGKYIATPVKSGIALIDYKRAQERILFDRLLAKTELKKLPAQQLLYPKEICLEEYDFKKIVEIRNVLSDIGIQTLIIDNLTLHITAYPPEFEDTNPKELLEELVYLLRDEPDMLPEKIKSYLCESAVRKMTAYANRKLSPDEMLEIINQLFTCRIPNYTNDGRTIIHTVELSEIERKFS